MSGQLMMSYDMRGGTVNTNHHAHTQQYASMTKSLLSRCQQSEMCNAGPTVQFEEAALDFGLLQVGNQAVQQLTVRNTSQYQSAWWTLREVSQQSTQPDSASSALKVDAQRAQYGMPAALQVKEQQLLQQLQDGQQTAISPVSLVNKTASTSQTSVEDGQQAATPPVSLVHNTASTSQPGIEEITELMSAVQQDSSTAGTPQDSAAAAMSTSTDQLSHVSSIADDAAASLGAVSEAGFVQGDCNPFLTGVEGRYGDQSGPRLQLESQCGRLKPGASATVQVTLQALDMSCMRICDMSTSASTVHRSGKFASIEGSLM